MDKKSFETVLDEIRKVITLNSLNHSMINEFLWFILFEELRADCAKCGL